MAATRTGAEHAGLFAGEGTESGGYLRRLPRILFAMVFLG
jgi:hypothetical protein